MKHFIILTVSLLITGCLTVAPAVKEAVIPPDAKIGIMTLLDDKPNHSHIGTTAFSNFGKPIDSDWGIGQLESYAVSRLENIKNYSVKVIEPTTLIKDERLELVKAGWSDLGLNKKLVQEFITLQEKNDIDFLVVIGPYDARVEYNVPVNSRGYGIYTHCVFKKCSAQALVHVRALAFDMSVPDLIAFGHVKNDGYLLDINFEKGVKSLPLTEYKKAKPVVIKHIKGLIDSVLVRSGFK